VLLSELRRRIESRQAKLGVIGLGYVGLPVACLFADAGFDVVGIDVKADRVHAINEGRSPIGGNEPGLAGLLARVVDDGSLRASTDYAGLADRDIITINVETPVNDDHQPRYEALRAVLQSLGPVLKSGALVIVESTLAPGTMADLVRPVLEAGSGKLVNEGFYLGHCPERVMPGKLLANLRGVSRVCGGETPQTAETMTALYRHVVRADLDPAECVTAELVKTAENAYRDVNIAFANEVALVCEAVGGDVWRVRDLVNKSPGRNMLYPGAGVGGHCIPKDPWLLIAQASAVVTPRLIPAARTVNDGMPLHVADLVVSELRRAGVDPNAATVLVLGYAYLQDSDDTRSSPSEKLVQDLRERGISVMIHDPYVSEYRQPLEACLDGVQAVVVMVAHSAYRGLDLDTVRQALGPIAILIDGRHVFEADRAREAGWVYRGIGEGRQERD